MTPDEPWRKNFWEAPLAFPQWKKWQIVASVFLGWYIFGKVIGKATSGGEKKPPVYDASFNEKGEISIKGERTNIFL